ncbi:Early light-induced protein 1, chloroplastic [Vitis vinifera]|uniref:Early light-induced protein 1, chloroplastic n=1 Tax=Vitis vinifera TaxID=29760 RepID=A0A438F830_VITVI|nr:Early light-induced protein 1, chloroplastic [Vitis vinifera]
MAMATTVQSTVATAMTRVANRTRDLQVVPPRSVLRLQRSAVQVRCTKEDGQSERPPPVTTNPQQPPSLSQSRQPIPPPPPPPAPKVSTKFGDVFAFSGPAPERINGRLAMVGFVAAMGAEIWKGEDVFAQISNGGIPWFLGTAVVLSLASLIPLFKGVSVESKSEGLMTSDAEMWNGRFAMLGLVALAFTEYLKGGALV